MYSIILFALLLASQNMLSQVTTYRGVVVDSSGANVSYAVVTSQPRRHGVNCDDQGHFSITVNKDSVQSLVFYCLGYEKAEIGLSLLDSFNIVTLHRASVQLGDFSISAGNRAAKHTAKLGKRHAAVINRTIKMAGWENGVFLEAKKAGGILQSAYIYVDDFRDSDPEAYFRVHIYEDDTLPQKEITTAEHIAHGEKGGGWVKVDLSNEHIQVNSGVYVGVEWMSDWTDGIAIGLRNNKQNMFCYIRNLYGKEWGFDWHDMVPMIYCTYTYGHEYKTGAKQEE